MADDSPSERDASRPDGPDPAESGDGPDPAEQAGDGPDDEGEGWKFELDEVDEEGIVDEREAIEPGSPSLESVVFVLLGALVTVGIIVRVAMVFAP